MNHIGTNGYEMATANGKSCRATRELLPQRLISTVLLTAASCYALSGCGGGGGGPANDADAACPSFSEKLAGSWMTESATTGLPRTLTFRPVNGDEGTVSGLATSLGFPSDLPLPYGIALTCDAVLITTGGNPDNLIRAMPAEFNGDGAWLRLKSGTRERYYWHADKPRPVYPASLYVKQIANLGPTQWKTLTGEVLLTGFGAFTAIGGLPAGQDYSGVQLIEEVTAVAGSDSCSALAQPALPAGAICSWDPSGAGFTFNRPHISAPAGLTPAQQDVFWDLHQFTSPTGSLLHRAGATSCSATCRQVYRYNGQQVGPAFTVTRTLTRDNANGATVVTVDKR